MPPKAGSSSMMTGRSASRDGGASAPSPAFISMRQYRMTQALHHCQELFPGSFSLLVAVPCTTQGSPPLCYGDSSVPRWPQGSGVPRHCRSLGDICPSGTLSALALSLWPRSFPPLQRPLGSTDYLACIVPRPAASQPLTVALRYTLFLSFSFSLCRGAGATTVRLWPWSLCSSGRVCVPPPAAFFLTTSSDMRLDSLAALHFIRHQ